MAAVVADVVVGRVADVPSSRGMFVSSFSRDHGFARPNGTDHSGLDDTVFVPVTKNTAESARSCRQWFARRELISKKVSDLRPQQDSNLRTRLPEAGHASLQPDL